MPARVALVQHVAADGQAEIYRAHVPIIHCDKPRGDLVLISNSGAVLADVFDTARPTSTAVLLARAVCAELKT